MLDKKTNVNPFEKGDIVLAVKGRDSGRVFVVVDTIDENYLLIANGRSRPLCKPKRKKAKHLKGVCRDGRQAKVSEEIFSMIGENLTDKLLWCEVSPFTEK